MSLPGHGYSLRSRAGSHPVSSPSSSSSKPPPPTSPTKRKKEDSWSDEDKEASEKLNEFHKVKISSKLELEPRPEVTRQKREHHHTDTPAYKYAPGSWGYITSKGGRKENQDFYVVPPDEAVDMANPNTALMFGVFDGHGIKGQEAARESGKWINAHFAAHNGRNAPPPAGGKTQEWVSVTLQHAFREAQASLLQVEAKNKNILDYGTTACVAIVRPSLHEMTIGWVGDARAAVVRWENVVSTPRISTDDSDSGTSMLGERVPTIVMPSNSFITTNTSAGIGGNSDILRNNLTSSSSGSDLVRTGSKDGGCSPFLNESPDSPASSTTTVDDSSSSILPTLQVVELTTDHVPQREDEKARVLQQGGVIRRVGGVVRVVAGGNYTEEQLRQQRLALNITRSLGHAILSKYGVSSEPDMLRTSIQPDDILIIASDGLWNELSSSEISSIALDCKMAGFSPQKFCNMLLRRAEVVSKLKGISADNITIVVYHHNC